MAGMRLILGAALVALILVAVQVLGEFHPEAESSLDPGPGLYSSSSGPSCDMVGPRTCRKCCGKMDDKSSLTFEGRKEMVSGIVNNVIECIVQVIKQLLSADLRFASKCCRLPVFSSIDSICPKRKLGGDGYRSSSRRTAFYDPIMSD